jgi:hypothetical protein
MMTDCTIPAYILALFDETDGDGGTGSAGGGGGDGAASGAGGDGQGGSSSGASGGGGNGRARGGDGRFQRNDDRGDVRQYATDLNDANRRIQELQEETKQRRLENKDLKTGHAKLAARIEVSDQRVIRSEAREALREAGVINTRVVDLFLADYADKIKIDEKTGEPTGIAENLADWKAKNADFFKADAAAGDATGQSGADSGADSGAAGGGAGGSSGGDGKNNATATGGSVAGGGDSAGAGTVGGLGDLRTMTPEQRRAAIAKYRQAAQGARGR